MYFLLCHVKFCLYGKSFAESACLAKTQVKRMLQNGNGFVRVFFQRNGLPAKNLFYVSDIALVAKTFAVAKLAEKYKNLVGAQFRLQICRSLFG